MKKIASIFVFMILVTLHGQAKEQPLSIYVNGQLFEGKSFLDRHDIYVESQPLAESLAEVFGLGTPLVFPSTIRRTYQGKTYVSLPAYAKIARLSFSVNWSTGIVDLYVPHLEIGNGKEPTIVFPLPVNAYASASSAGGEAGSASGGFVGGYYPPPLDPRCIGYSPLFCGPELFPPRFLPQFSVVPSLPQGWSISNGMFLEDENGHIIRFLP